MLQSLASGSRLDTWSSGQYQVAVKAQYLSQYLGCSTPPSVSLWFRHFSAVCLQACYTLLFLSFALCKKKAIKYVPGLFRGLR